MATGMETLELYHREYYSYLKDLVGKATLGLEEWKRSYLLEYCHDQITKTLLNCMDAGKEIEKPHHWLRVVISRLVTKRRVFTQVRFRLHQLDMGELNMDTYAQDNYIENEVDTALLMDQCPARFKELLSLMLLGYSQEDMCQHFNVNYIAMRKRVQRMRDYFRTHIERQAHVIHH